MTVDSQRQITVIIKILHKLLIQNIVICLQRTRYQLAVTDKGQRAAKICSQRNEKAQLLDTMARDKKKNGNSITLIILQQIGEGVLQKVDWQEVPKYLG